MRKFLRVSVRGRHILEAYGFISFWIAGFFLFMAIPLAQSFYYSFNKLKLGASKMTEEYIGWGNYRFSISVDTQFVPILMRTIRDMLIHVPLILIFAMFCALLLNKPMFGRIFFRGVFFLPVIIATGNVLKKLLEGGATRLPIFEQYNLEVVLQDYIPVEFLGPLLQMMDSLTLVMWGSGVQILIFIAGLQTIPQSLYEAAKCDGATPWQNFWKITFPMIIPMTLINTLFSIVDSFTKANNEMMGYINSVAFRDINFGYASAIGWIYFFVIFIIIGIVLLMFRKSSVLSR